MVEDSPVVLDGQSLGADDVVRVARYHAPVALHHRFEGDEPGRPGADAA